MDILYSIIIFFATLEETAIVARMPTPTVEIKKHIENLGNDSFAIRENASAALQKEGYKALRALENNSRSSDPEVGARIFRLLESYYSVSFPNNTVPGILRIPVAGETITWKNSQYKIESAVCRRIYKHFWLEAHPDEEPWFDNEVSQKAMRFFVKKLLRFGVPKVVVEEWLGGLSNNEDFDPSDFEGYHE